MEYVGSAREEDRRFALLQEVFEAFPDIPINIDIKINDNRLISKVSALIKQYNREEYTVWGNFSDEVTQKCYKMVCIKKNYLILFYIVNNTYFFKNKIVCDIIKLIIFVFVIESKRKLVIFNAACDNVNISYVYWFITVYTTKRNAS